MFLRHRSASGNMNREFAASVLFLVICSGARCLADEAGEPTFTAAINVTVCDLVADPQRFHGKIVRVQAQYEADMLLSVLIDPQCPNAGGVMPSGNANSSPVGDSLMDALFRHGCFGTTGKQITAAWVGEYHWEPQNTPGTGKVPRWIDVQKIENLEVKPRPLPFPFDCPP